MECGGRVSGDSFTGETVRPGSTRGMDTIQQAVYTTENLRPFTNWGCLRCGGMQRTGFKTVPM